MSTATLKAATCGKCRETFDYEPHELHGRELFAPKFCPPCVEIISKETDAEARYQRKAKLTEAWESLCPMEYRECDPARISATYARLIREWTPGPRGIGLVGTSGICKTRTVFAIMRRHHMAGLRCEAISAAKFSKLAVDQFSNDNSRRGESLAKLESCQTARILILDDLEKARFSDRYEMELYNLLEHRTSEHLPILWTANTIGDDLAAMFTPERQEPIMRRLVDFSEIL